MTNWTNEKTEAKAIVEAVIGFHVSKVTKKSIQLTLDVLDGSIDITGTWEIGIGQEYRIGPYKAKSPLRVFVMALQGEPWLKYNLSHSKAA